MRILSGIYRGQKLKFPDREILRPTQEKVRAAVFNILHDRIKDCRFLDLCSGTGSMGIEALSRGAKHVHFVDINTSLLEENIKNLKPASNPAHIQISQMPMGRFLSMLRPNSFDVIFCDPPWKELERYTEAMLLLAKTECLSPSGILFIEHHRDYPPLPNGREKNSGPIAISGDEQEMDVTENRPIHEGFAKKSTRKKSHKHRLTGRELDEAEYMAMTGFGEKPTSKHKKSRDSDSVLQFDDDDGQWIPASKKVSRKQITDSETPPNINELHSTIHSSYPNGFPLVVSHVYGYSDTHITRMEYPQP